MNGMDKKKKLTLIISIIILIILGIASATVAYFGWVAEEEATIDVTILSEGTGRCEWKSDNTVELEPVASRNSGRIIKFTANQLLAQTAPIAWNMVINSIDGLKHETFKYEMINTTTGVSYGSGNFADITNGDNIYFSNSTEVLAFNKEYEFTLYLWIDGTIGNNPLSMAGQNIDFDMNCVIGESVAPNTNLKEHITNLYASSNPTLITHSKADGTSDTYYYSYQDDTQTWGLMNDGLKVSSTEGAGATVITDTTSLTSGTEGNIRYFGPSDSVNNYIYFNCSDYSDTSTCEKWRIIGIIDGKVKIIRDEPIGNYAFHHIAAEERVNIWNNATLKSLLNDTYFYSDTTIYYDDYGAVPVEKEANFSANGITNATRENNLISESTWYINGSGSSEVYANSIYKIERTGTNTWLGYIALLYPSDYGYASDLNNCKQNLKAYSDSNCINSNWIQPIMTTTSSALSGWLLTPNTTGIYATWYVKSSGIVDLDNTDIIVSSSINVVPAIYLDPEIRLISGNGSEDFPYQLSI